MKSVNFMKAESTLDELNNRHKMMSDLVAVFGRCLPSVCRAFNESEGLNEELGRVHRLRIDPDVETVMEFIDRVCWLFCFVLFWLLFNCKRF